MAGAPAARSRKASAGLRITVCCGLVAAALTAGCAGCGDDRRATSAMHDTGGRSPGTFSPTRSRPFSIPEGLSTTKRGFVFRVAADARHLVWMTGPVEEESLPTTVQQRELGSGRRVMLAKGIDPGYGLGSTSNWVVYGVTSRGTQLMAVRHDGSGRIELSPELVAPIAARGELIAWAEHDRARQRVVVRDMAAGRTWVAASMPRCEGTRCWRIDAVTLADDGVVFTRVASNPDASTVMRRAFTESAPSQVRISGDPQPELLPSSAGALYYVLGRGWYRWDFGRAKPSRTSFRANPPAPLVGFEDDRWFVLSSRGCRSGLVAVSRGRRSTTISSSARLLRLVGSRHGTCVQFGGLTWTGNQALTGWGLLPEEEEEEEAHETTDLTGVVSVGRRLRQR